MLAAIGFITTGILVTVFADTFDRHVAKPYKLHIWQFSAAYYSLALALMIWGVASLTQDSQILRFAVLAGDGWILAGSVLLLSLVNYRKYYYELLLVEVSLAITLLCTRAVFYSPAPVVRDGLLYFNTQRPAAIAIGALFALVWLPVNVLVAKLVTDRAKLTGLNQLYTSLYVGAVLAALFFLGARRAAAVVVSFSGVALMFLLLIFSNLVVRKGNRKQEKAHATK